MSDDTWMHEALALADQASALREVPVGAVVVDDQGTRIGAGYNRRETDSDPTAHAELLALREAAKTRGAWRLDGCTLYVTLEPCVMCAGALVNARIKRVVWGCDDPKSGAGVSLYEIGQDERLNHRFASTRGVLGAECAERLKTFFASLRATKSSS